MGAPGRIAALEILKDWKRRQGRDEGGRTSSSSAAGTTAWSPRRCWRKGGLKPLVLERRDVAGRRRRDRGVPPGLQGLDGRPRARAAARRPWSRTSASRTAGSRFIEPEPRVFAPLPDGRGVALWGDAGTTAVELRTLSPRGRRALPRVPPLALRRSPRCSARLLAMTPPDIDQPLERRPPAAGSGWAWASAAWAARTRSACCAGGRWRWPTSRPSGSRRSSCARWSAARGHLRRRSPGPGRRAPPRTCCSRPRPRAATARAPPCSVMGGLGALAEALAAAAARSTARRSARAPRSSASRSRTAASTGVVLAGGEEIAARRRGLRRRSRSARSCGLLDPAVLDPDDLRRDPQLPASRAWPPR